MNRAKLKNKYIFYDILASLLVLLVFIICRKVINDIPVFYGLRVFLPTSYYLLSFVLYPFFCYIIHYLSGFYLHPENTGKTKIIISTLISAAITSVLVFFFLMLDDVVVSYRYYYNSLLLLIALQFTITLIFRLSIKFYASQHFKSQRWSIKTIIIGSGDVAIKMADVLQKNNSRNSLVGFVTVDRHVLVPQKMVLGNINQIENIITQHQIDEAIIALDQPDEQKLFSYINSLFRFNIGIKFTPRLYEILTGSAQIGSLGTHPLVNITKLAMPDWQVCVKRFVDIVVSLVSLIFLAIPFAIIGIAIKSSSKGSVFYCQERIGYHAKPFKIVKFRSMYTDSENGTPRLSNPDDERITPIGRLLRRYRIDELPQFFNILIGDMSLVGPRPERNYFIRQIIEQAPYYCLLYKIRPGLTSWGPIKIGYADTLEKMIERLNYDIIYIENMSLFNDLKILTFTIEIIFKGKGM
ncbi:MAG: sugar transferase [Paludibacter sp.]|jgi:exopolysaccharide biosynthesis polyprenyl glycosylphosphotransferase|nr:sugar transferase [Paludibacter sp.]